MRSVFRSLRFRLFLVVMVMTALIVGVQLYSRELQYRALRDEIWSDITSLTDVSASNLGQVVEGSRQLLSAIGHNQAIRTYDPSGSEFLARLLKDNPQYTNLTASKPDGLAYASAVPSKTPVVFSDRPWFRRAVQSGRFSASDYLVGRVVGKGVFGFGYPVYDDDGKLLAVLAVSFDLDWLNRFVAQMKLPPGATQTAFDVNGTIIVQNPDPDAWVGKATSEAPLTTMIRERKFGQAEAPGVDGVERMYGFASVPGTEDRMFVAIGVPHTIAFSRADYILRVSLFLLLGVAGMGLAVSSIMGELTIMRPIRRVTAASVRLGEGDLTARVQALKAGNEFIPLASAFNAMASSLESRERELRAAEQEVRRLNAELEERVSIRTRELEVANKDLESFSYSVSHDLRAPVRAIVGFAHMLREDYAPALDDEGLRRTETIISSASRLGTMIDSLLEFSRLGRAAIRPTTVDIRRLAIGTVEELKQRYPETEIELQFGTLTCALGDETLLRYALTNLLSNAVKFAKPGGPAQIEIGCWDDTDQNEVVYFVRDHGVGFDMAYVDKLFGVFQRLHTEFEGNGIGLALVKRIIERHGGRVWAEGREGEGATFYFALPR